MSGSGGSRMSKKNFGEYLVQQEKISIEQLSQAKVEQKQSGVYLSTALVRIGAISEREVTELLADFHNLQMVELESFEIDPEVIKLVPKNICLKHKIVPVTQSLGTLVVACSQPGGMMIADDLRFVTSLKIEFVIASENAIENAIAKHYDAESLGSVISDLEVTTTNISDDDLSENSSEDDEPIIRFVNLALSEAVKSGASDIHVEPYEGRFRIRFRVDGRLVEKLQPPQGAAGAIINRIKILSRLDISEKRRPQDGRIKVRISGKKEVEFRVSTVPSMYGEKVVLRLLDKSGLNKPMTDLGFEIDDLKKFKEAIFKPVGMVLVTGPTGSGKSTTVYSALNELNSPEVNICTAEDPIEMNIEGINHVQANSAIDLNFSNILRSFLRQDPDIIFVGEIRDLETAEIAFKAASTGHLVISTLHTNDAASTISRLTEIGIPPYLVASTVSLIVAQRLVGLICESCKNPIKVQEQVLLDLGIPAEETSKYQIYDGEGCGVCSSTGIRGRIAIHEVMPMTASLRDSILSGASTKELRSLAVTEGMRSLRGNALLKLEAGLTSIEQVIGATIKD